MPRRETSLSGEVDQARRVLEADERWIAAFNQEDVETIVSIYAPDVVVMPPDRPDLHGRAAVERFLRELFRTTIARQSLTNEEVHAAGDWAFLRGFFQLELRSRSTGVTTKLRGKHLVVWRRAAGGEWLAARDIWSESR